MSGKTPRSIYRYHREHRKVNGVWEIYRRHKNRGSNAFVKLIANAVTIDDYLLAYDDHTNESRIPFNERYNPVEYNGVTYRNIRELAKHLHISPQKVFLMIRVGQAQYVVSEKSDKTQLIVDAEIDFID